MMNRHSLAILAIAMLVPALAQTSPFYAVSDFGAAGDGVSKDTAAIQKAIDACAAAGGGTVYFGPGTYLSGSLHLRSNLTLLLDNGAILLASKDDADFDPFEELDFENDSDEETSFFHYSLLWGEDLEGVAILGQGTIDSNRNTREGPKTIGLKRCRKIAIRDITIQNAGNYAISMLGTDDVNIDGITIRRAYCDGIDPDCCHNVRISNSYIESWDDAIVPKTSLSLGYRRSTEYITVTNCILRTSSNAFKLGTESGGDFKHISVSNCVVAPFESKVDYREPTPPISGVTLISADGANIENVLIDNIAMEKARFPIFLRLANRGRDLETPVPGTMKKVTISNVSAEGALIGAIIVGHPERPIEDIFLDRIAIASVGGGAKNQAEMDVPGAMVKYPSAYKFKDLHTYGVYARHVKGIRLDGLHLSLDSPDTRHALITHDVEKLDIEGFRAPAVKDAVSTLHLGQTRGVLLRGSQLSGPIECFLRVTGPDSHDIALLDNDLRKASKTYFLADGAHKGAVVLKGNL
jgi:hypothetical protein